MTQPSSSSVVAAEQISRAIDAELARARKTHPSYFRGGASVPEVPKREKLPPAVLIVRRQGTSKDYPLVGNVRPCIGGSGDRLAFRDVDDAADHARINGYNLRLELDKPIGYPWPTRNALEVTPEQVAQYEARQVEAAA